MPIVLDKNGLLEQIRSNPYTKVGGNEVCPANIINVWDTINTLLQRILCSGQGAKIHDFFSVTFNVLEVETPTGEGNVRLQRNPHVFLANNLVLKHSLRVKRPRNHFEISEASLNITHVAKICRMTRNAVQRCLQEIITAFDRALAEDDQVELWLTKIGKIIVESKSVRVGYCSSFLTLLGYSEGVKQTFISNTARHSEDYYEDYLFSSRGSSAENEMDENSQRSTSVAVEDTVEEDLTGEENAEEEEIASKSSTVPETPPDPPASSPDRHSIVSGCTAETAPLQEEEMEEAEKPEEMSSSPEDEIQMAKALKALVARESIVRETFIVWETISKYVMRKLKEGVAVKIAGLGTFASRILRRDLTREEESDTINPTFQTSKKFPLFKICQHLKEMNALVEENYPYQCDVPIINLNTKIISKAAKLGHGVVDGILLETLQAFAQGIITNKNLQFPFPFIGKLNIKAREIRMFFYEEFCEGLFSDPYYSFSNTEPVIPAAERSPTPLPLHRPSTDFQSVFHYEDMKLVKKRIRVSTPSLYHEGSRLIRDRNEDRCSFLQKLYSHSHFTFECFCQNCTERKKPVKCLGPAVPKSPSVDGIDENSKTEITCLPSTKTVKCKNNETYERIQKACYTKPGTFSFKQSDGSTFFPETLFRTAHTGNPILDKLTDDKCRLHEALGCWMKKGFTKTLGAEEVAKHYDRSYFRKIEERKKLLEEEKEEDLSQVAVTPEDGSDETKLSFETEAFSLMTAESHKKDSFSVKWVSSTHDGADATSEVDRKSEGSTTKSRSNRSKTSGKQAEGQELEKDGERSSIRDDRTAKTKNSEKKGSSRGSSTREGKGGKGEGDEYTSDEEATMSSDYYSESEISEVLEDDKTVQSSSRKSKRRSSRGSSQNDKRSSKKSSRKSDGATTEPSEGDEEEDANEDEDYIPLQEIFESEWFEKSKEEEEEESDKEMKLLLNEDEVTKKLGLSKKKKKCKEKPKPEFEKLDIADMFANDEFKKKNYHYEHNHITLKMLVERAYQLRNAKPTEGSHNLVTPRDFGRRQTLDRTQHKREKKVIHPNREFRHQQHHHETQTTQTSLQPSYEPSTTTTTAASSMVNVSKSKPPRTPPESLPRSRSDPWGRNRRNRSPESRSKRSNGIQGAQSLIFKSASDLLFSSPPATFAPKTSLAERREAEAAFSNVFRMGGGGGDSFNRRMRMPLTSADSYRNLSPPQSSDSERSQRQYQFGASLVPKFKFHDDQLGQQQQLYYPDIMDNNNNLPQPDTATIPSSSKMDSHNHNVCYATFCPSQRREADMCYMRNCFKPCKDVLDNVDDVCCNFNDCVIHDVDSKT